MYSKKKEPSYSNINEKIKKLNILVIGDIILDRYYFGDAERLSPEAPVPILNYKNTEEKLGGAANVAMNITSLGANCTLIGTIGKDEEGKILKDLLKKYNIKNHLNESSELRTISKTRILGKNQQLLRIDFENKKDNKLREINLNKFKSLIKSCDLVIISDYLKGTIPNCNEYVSLVKSLNKKILIDPKGKSFGKYKGATLLTPNYIEFENVVGKCSTENEIILKGTKLLEELNLNALLITRSKKGMTLIQRDFKPIYLPANTKEVFDVTGAGDTVIAILGVMIALETSIKKAMEISNNAAGIVITRLGTAGLNINELLSLYSKLSKPARQCSLLELKDYINILKLKNKKIVMTNGCFDILHEGHINYLEKAKGLGDILIIAVNDDNSIKRLKGESRPINNLKSRMKVLSGLRCVDFVIDFTEDTPINLFKELLPDIIVKGGDYKDKEVIGADLIKEKGGEVRILEFFEGYSTTKIIEKIQFLRLNK